MPTAIVVLSDPTSSSDEAFGRVFNALATAYDYLQAGDDVARCCSKEPAPVGSVNWSSPTIQRTSCSKPCVTPSPESRVHVRTSSAPRTWWCAADVPLLDDNPVPGYEWSAQPAQLHRHGPKLCSPSESA